MENVINQQGWKNDAKTMLEATVYKKKKKFLSNVNKEIEKK